MKKKMDIVFLLDRSGSMSGAESDTIGGFNNYIKKNRNNKFETNVTTILFDDRYEVLHDRISIKDVKELTNEDYYVRGSTALLDAIGKTINTLDRKDTDKVLFVITTDGYENASREYDNNKIKKLIKKHDNWEFMYIGADIDSYTTGGNLGISRKNIANYKKDRKGVGLMFDAVGKFACSYACDEETSNWKEELDNYIFENEE